MRFWFMHKLKIKWIFFVIYILLILILYLSGRVPTDIHLIREQLMNVDHILFWYFLISTLRIVLFIPQTVFILLGGLLFDPWIVFLISILAHAISESIIYFFTKGFLNVNQIQSFINRNKKIVHLLERYKLRLLALGVSCPFAPSDLLSSASAIVGIKYFPYILTVIIAGTPLTLLYAFMGEQATKDSTLNFIFIGIFILIFSLLSLRMYRTIMKNK